MRLGDTTVTSRPDGSYSLVPDGDPAVVRVFRMGFTSSERRASVASGTGSVVFDARLTPLAEPLLVSGDDLTLGTEVARWNGSPVSASLSVPAAAFAGPVALHFTPLSPQGLPALLPHGWSPVAAFELRLAAADPSAPETDPEAAFAPIAGALPVVLRGLPEGALAFVAHDRAAHGWRSVSQLSPILGEANAALGALGAYAVVVADSGSPAIPAPGVLLDGVQPAAFPVGIAARAAGVPASLPAGAASPRAASSFLPPRPFPPAFRFRQR